MSDANGSDTPMSDDELFVPEVILQDALRKRSSDGKIERSWLIKWKGFPPVCTFHNAATSVYYLESASIRINGFAL